MDDTLSSSSVIFLKSTAWLGQLAILTAFMTCASPHRIAHYTRELKKGDRVRISGEISYRPFKDAEGNNRKQASIVNLHRESALREAGRAFTA